MRLPGALTKSFVMALVAWSALILAPVVVVGPPLAAGFLILALALAACTTLRFSLLAGAGVALASACLFATALAFLDGPGQATLDLTTAVRSLTDTAVALPALLAAVGLIGAVAFAELVAMGLERDVTPPPAAGPPRPIRRVRVARRRLASWR